MPRSNSRLVDASLGTVLGRGAIGCGGALPVPDRLGCAQISDWEQMTMAGVSWALLPHASVGSDDVVARDLRLGAPASLRLTDRSADLLVGADLPWRQGG